MCVVAHIILRYMDAGSGAQIRPQLPHRGIKPEIGEKAGSIFGGYIEGPLVPTDQIRQAGVLNLNSFGLACRTGGVNDICKVLRFDLRQ